MKTILTAFLGLLIGTSPLYAGQEVRNGGDVFEIGKAKVVWDAVEYGTPFDATQLEAFKLVDAQLQMFGTKLPRTAKLIRNQFHNNFWYFVDSPLKEIEDEGTSPLALTYNKIQAAIHMTGRIFIRKDLWDQMSSSSQAYLLLHENLWALNTDASISVSGENIRAQVGLIMNPFIKDVTKETLRVQLYNLSRVAYGNGYDSNGALASPINRAVVMDAQKVLFVHRYSVFFPQLGVIVPKAKKYTIDIPAPENMYSDCRAEVKEGQDQATLEITGRRHGKTEVILEFQIQRSTEAAQVVTDLVDREYANLQDIIKKEQVICR